MSDFDTLVRLLRCWTHNHDPHVRAAVELLIEHETWMRRAGFQRACIEKGAREAWINWRKAREFVDAGATASTSEMAVLDLAVAIGENRYKFSIMGPANSRMKIRLHGTEDECREGLQLLEQIMLVQSVRGPYRDRNRGELERSVLVRVYVEAIPRGAR